MAESYSKVASHNLPKQEPLPTPAQSGGLIPQDEDVPVSVDGNKVADSSERLEEDALAKKPVSPVNDSENGDNNKKSGKECHKKGKKSVCHNKSVYRSVIGFGNIAIVAGLGIAAYQNWNRPWDRRVVSSIAIGLGAIFGAEGYFGVLEYKGHKGHHNHHDHHDHHKHHKKH